MDWFDWDYIRSTVVAMGAGLALFAGILASLAAIIAIPAKGRNWLKNRLQARRQRREALEQLIITLKDVKNQLSDAEQIEAINAINSELSARGEWMANTDTTLENVDSSLAQLHQNNARMLGELQLLSSGVLALLDWAIKQGANGRAHKAFDDLQNYNLSEAHKNTPYTVKPKKGGNRYENRLGEKALKPQILGVTSRSGGIHYQRRGEC